MATALVLLLRATAAPELRPLQKVELRGTVLAPEGAAAEGAMRVRAWRRTLACPRVDDRTIEAARLFRGRYIGRRP